MCVQGLQQDVLRLREVTEMEVEKQWQNEKLRVRLDEWGKTSSQSQVHCLWNELIRTEGRLLSLQRRSFSTRPKSPLGGSVARHDVSLKLSDRSQYRPTNRIVHSSSIVVKSLPWCPAAWYTKSHLSITTVSNIP